MPWPFSTSAIMDVQAVPEEVQESPDAGTDLDAENSPLEDHIAQSSPLQRMAQDSRRVDQMPEKFSPKTGQDLSSSPESRALLFICCDLQTQDGTSFNVPQMATCWTRWSLCSCICRLILFQRQGWSLSSELYYLLLGCCRQWWRVSIGESNQSSPSNSGAFWVLHWGFGWGGMRIRSHLNPWRV